MSLSMKLRLAFLIWIVGGFALGVTAVTVSSYFFIPMGLLFVGVGLFTLNLRCPHCNARVLITPVNAFGLRVPAATSWIPRKCPNCRREL